VDRWTLQRRASAVAPIPQSFSFSFSSSIFDRPFRRPYSSDP
jgi:hypothetical protein